MDRLFESFDTEKRRRVELQSISGIRSPITEPETGRLLDTELSRSGARLLVRSWETTMKVRSNVSTSLVWIGLLLFGLSSNAVPVSAQQPHAAPAESNSSANSTAREEPASQIELPSCPSTSGSEWQSAQNQPGSPNAQSTSTALEEPQSPKSVPPQQPVGTAAAGPSKASGIAAAQPAGIAIAPAKQRRVRTIVLRFGAVVGAGVAVGTVVTLSRATPSKPPGAR